MNSPSFDFHHTAASVSCSDWEWLLATGCGLGTWFVWLLDATLKSHAFHANWKSFLMSWHVDIRYKRDAKRHCPWGEITFLSEMLSITIVLLCIFNSSWGKWLEMRKERHLSCRRQKVQEKMERGCSGHLYCFLRLLQPNGVTFSERLQLVLKLMLTLTIVLMPNVCACFGCVGHYAISKYVCVLSLSPH